MFERRGLPSLLRFVWPYMRSSRKVLGVGLLCITVARTLEATLPFYLGALVTRIAVEQQMPHVQEIAWVFVWILAASGLEVCVVFLRNRFGERVQKELREALFSHILQLPISFFSYQRMGSLLTQVVHDIEKIREMLADGSIAIVGNVLLFLGIYGGIFFVNTHIFLGFLLLSPFVFLVFWAFQTNQRKTYQEFRAALSSQNAFLEEAIVGHQTFRSWVREQVQDRQLEQLAQECMRTQISSVKTFSLFIGSIDLFLGGFWVFCFTTLTLLATPNAPFNPGTYFTLTLWGFLFFRPLFDLADRLNALLAGAAALERVEQLFESPQEKDSGQIPLTHFESLEFHHVSFQYTQGPLVLDQISFSLQKGESLGVVGVTGSGKTTLLHLLLRFYTPTSGVILVNGIPIERYEMKSYRRQFGLVLQDSCLFEGSVADNIQFLDPTIVPKPLPSLCLTDAVSYGGQNLSEGQKQLISWARAMSSKASCLVLDEATAHMDYETEQTLLEVQASLVSEATSLVIAHRLTTLKGLDQIVVLHQGRLVQKGSARELLEEQGLFHHFWSLGMESDAKI